MRHPVALLATCLILGACSSHKDQPASADNQAEALDNAAQQSDPVAAAELQNQADTIRNSGAEANMSDPNSPAQNALQSAGNAAAQNASNTTQPK